MLRRLLGKVAIVTGAGQGLGEALAHRLGREGAHVVVADIADDKAQSVAQAIAEQYGRQDSLGSRRCDRSGSDARRWLQRTVETFGRLDILVSNAGILIAGEITEIDPAQLAQGDRRQPGRLLSTSPVRRRG